MKIIFFSFFILFYNIPGHGQENHPSHIDSLNMQKANSVAEIVFGKELNNSTYLLFSFIEYFWVIEKHNDGFEIHFFLHSKDFNKTVVDQFEHIKTFSESANEKLIDLFNNIPCNDSFVYSGTFESPEYVTRWAYYVFYQEGTKKCELTSPIAYAYGAGNSRRQTFDFKKIKVDVFRVLYSFLLKETRYYNNY